MMFSWVLNSMCQSRAHEQPAHAEFELCHTLSDLLVSVGVTSDASTAVKRDSESPEAANACQTQLAQRPSIGAFVV